MLMTELHSQEIHEINHLICQIGRRAEEMACADLQIEEKAADDFVTKVDREINAALLEAMRQRFPNDGFITEELPPDEGVEKYKRIWLIDPLDGTDNYLKRDGQYAVMIGLLFDCRPVFGWIYAPARDKLYFGGEGYGIYCTEGDARSQPMVPASENQTVSTVRVIMGGRDPFREQVAELLGDVEWVKMGSLGLKAIHIIEGHADLYLHLVRKLKIWDTAAPVALAKAAGLRACSLTGEEITYNPEQPLHQERIIIGRPSHVTQAIERLKSLGD
jgi:3'(2'), 5'-bisphosphate nucleotidase